MLYIIYFCTLYIINLSNIKYFLSCFSSQKPWQMFQKGIMKDNMYSADAPYMQDLLDSLSHNEIQRTHMFKGGSQVKLFFWFANGNTALVKPMRMKRDDTYPYSSKHPFWLDPERHNAEIASFHLDRILNFRRAVPVAGRLINMTKEILQKSSDKELLDTFFWKDGNLCFIGVCAPWFCNDEHPICGIGDMLEVSVAQFIPKSPSSKYAVFDRAYPWSQGVKESKVWKNTNICDQVLMDLQNTNDRTFLDLIDLAIFDFLIVNYDRHSYTLLSQLKNESFVTILDNGKGFGNPNNDDLTLLAPVYQCCKVRRSTYYRLKELKNSKLSTSMRSSMSHDAISPILSEAFLAALDRRLMKAIEIIQKCFLENGEDRVLMGY
ncbi:extracellular serine/threonine protein kinase FAM20C-like [Anneissia japonica]|uniref:extracellular serine/threonine protein kinase FAM20C-like n=1 Tax=Anneissia japonica TaxID=1529436 RepID=UPI0014256E7C|nr:extracellular serine/threonine protein kinase FAM20C-like [Anneissia japonica]